jgi:protein phosphatase
MKVRYSAQTDVGRRRSENQDSILGQAAADGNLYLFVVADGVGSLAAGADASRNAVDTLATAFPHFSEPEPGPHLIEGIRKANTYLYHESHNRGAGAMGSTLVAVVVRPNEFGVAHVGDSRAYLVRDGSIRRLTEDHSLVAEQVRAGILTEQEASESRHRHIITRSLGAEIEVDVEHNGMQPLEPGDIFVLCSDGLHDVVTDAEIGAMVLNRDPKEATTMLIQMANERGGPDNVSVIVAVVDSPDSDG